MRTLFEWHKFNEFKLAEEFAAALGREDYKTCKEIKREVDMRIKNDQLDPEAMSVFSEAALKTLNGLFDKYFEEE